MQSKRALLEWLKNDLQVDIKTIEELGKGFIYAQLLANYDNTFPAKNINKNAKSEAEYLKNLKLCQDYFSRNSITVFFPIDKMAKCKVQDNLEFIQWLYKFLHKKDEKEGGGKISSSVDNSVHNTSSSSHPKMRVMKQAPVAQSTKENQNRPNLSGQQSNLADNSFNKSMTTASNKATASTTKIKSHFSANKSRQESSNAIIENYAAGTNICKTCVENSEIIEKYKSQHFYLESKIKYYEKMNAEVDKKSEELAIKENSLKEKESVLMRQALINMDESKEVKRMEDKLAILQDELKLANEALIDCKQKNLELEIRNKEILLHINNLEKNEEKSREEFANEVEKLKEYYEGIINNKDKEFGEAKINYLQFIKGYEKERDMYYVKLKEVEAYLKQHCGNEELKNNIFHLLYKKE